MAMLRSGQVWVCGAVGSTPPLMCLIGKLDQFSDTNEGSRTVSVHVTPHPEAKKAGWPSISHMPVFEDAFRKSELRLVKEGVALGQDFEDGYAQWLSAYHDGKAGAFSIQVSDAYEGIVSVQSGS